MSLFVFDEEENLYCAKMDGIEFICEEAAPELEKAVPALAEAYGNKLPQIVAFMMDDITEMFGDITEDRLTEALGTPQIDLDREVIAYLEHTLDDSHIIEIEYGGLLDEFYGVSIDG